MAFCTWPLRPGESSAPGAAPLWDSPDQPTGSLVVMDLDGNQLYSHYDVLAGVRAMAELGRIGDPRCADALDLLESKQLPDGGWPAEARYYKHSTTVALGNDDVDWGGTSTRRSNPWVTVEALAVLRASGRLAL